MSDKDKIHPETISLDNNNNYNNTANIVDEKLVKKAVKTREELNTLRERLDRYDSAELEARQVRTDAGVAAAIAGAKTLEAVDVTSRVSYKDRIEDNFDKREDVHKTYGYEHWFDQKGDREEAQRLALQASPSIHELYKKLSEFNGLSDSVINDNFDNESGSINNTQTSHNNETERDTGGGENDGDYIATSMDDSSTAPESRGWFRSPYGTLLRRTKRKNVESTLSNRKAPTSTTTSVEKKELKKLSKKKKRRRRIIVIIAVALLLVLLILLIQSLILLIITSATGRWSSLPVGSRYKSVNLSTVCNCGCLVDSSGDGYAGMLPGNNNPEKIWNYFVSAGIQGVSDNPAVIAGILGNIQQESSFEPFILEGGLYQHLAQEFKDAMYVDGYEAYWFTLTDWSKGLKPDIPIEANDTMIKMTLDYLTKVNSNWDLFVSHLNSLENADGTLGAQGYAELFCVFVERCYRSKKDDEDTYILLYRDDADTSENYIIMDNGVQNAINTFYTNQGSSAFANVQYQEIGSRRDYAVEWYNKFANSGATNAVGGVFDSNTDITFIGDSIGASVTGITASLSVSGDPTAFELTAPLPSRVGGGSYINSLGGRHITNASSEPDGITVLNAILGTEDLKEYIVIELGTNTTQSEADINTLITILNELNDKKVVFVTPYLAESYDSTQHEWVEKTAEWMREQADTKSNVAVADWNNLVKSQPDLLGNDGIHLKSSDSYEPYVNLIINALSSFSSGSVGGGGGSVVCNCNSDCPCWEVHGTLKRGVYSVGAFGVLSGPYVMPVDVNDEAWDTEAKFLSIFANTDTSTKSVDMSIGGKWIFYYIAPPFEVVSPPFASMGTTTSPAYLRNGFSTDDGGFVGPMMHSADFQGGLGTQYLAIADGTIVDVTKSYSNSGYGNTVTIDHGGGFQTMYCHLQYHLDDAVVGTSVKGGEAIPGAFIGSTGASTGPHLHFEMFYNEYRLIPFYYIGGYDNENVSGEGSYVPPFADPENPDGYFIKNPYN